MSWMGAVLAVAGTVGLSTQAAEETTRKALPVAKLTRTDPVEFYRDIVPIFRESCLPCHNRTTTKADLLLETPADILKGGESGTALIPGKSAESLLFKVSAHLEKPRMPPKDNKVNAPNLTPEQLGLLQLWIDQGAKAGQQLAEVIQWQPMPDRVDAIMAVAVSSNGRYAACGRGNQIEVYRISDGAVLSRPADPALVATNGAAAGAGAGAAHRDLVNALALSPDGEWLASGGFREVKLWHREYVQQGAKASDGSEKESPGIQEGGRAVSPDGRVALSIQGGHALLSDADGKRWVMELRGDLADTEERAAARRRITRLGEELGRVKTHLEIAEKELGNQRERVKKSGEALAAAQAAVTAKQPSVDAARKARYDAETALIRLQRRPAKPAVPEAELKAANEKITAAGKDVDKAEQELKPLVQKLESARNERELAIDAVGRAELAVSADQIRVARLTADRTQSIRSADEADARALGSLPTVLAAGISPDSRRVVTSHADQVLRIWNAADGAPVDRIALSQRIESLSFKNGTELRGVAGKSESIHLRLDPDWVPVRSLGTDGRTNAPAFADRVNALAFRPDGQRLAVGGGEPTRGGDLSVWEPSTGRLVFAVPALHSDSILSLTYSPDGTALLSGGADRFGRVLDAASARQIRALEGHTGHVLGVAWSPEGSTLATAGADMVVKFWDAATGEKRKQATGLGREATAVGFLGVPGRVVIASGDGELRVVDDSGGRVSVYEGSSDFVYGLGISGDSEWIVAGGQDRTLRFWKKGGKDPVFQRDDSRGNLSATGK
jgi:WD40 repeat protein